MDKIKWGLSFLVFSLVVSVVWGFIYAEDITSVNRLSTFTSTAFPITTSATTGEITTNKTETQLPITTTTTITTPTINTTTTQLQTTTSGGGGGGTNTSTLYIPEAPSGLRLDGIVIPYNISLSWNDNSNNEDKFVIEKKLSSASVWSSLAQVDTNILHYVDTKVIPNTAYDYRITTCLSGIGCSSYYTLDKVYTTTPIESVKSVIPTTTINPIIPTTIINPSPTTTTTNTPTAPLTPPIPPTPPTTITTTPTKPVEPVILTTPTTTNPNIEVASSSAEIKAPVPLEIPKDIIESVTAALNIIPTSLPEIKTDEEITKLVYQDTNKDGISDYDSKYVYNMDPVKTSPVSTYEGKSITAGEKILLGFDPGKKELEKVVVEEPTTSKGEVVVSSYKVREVALTEKKEVVLKGQALPNSFITIYIYSTPIMVTVKTDSNGEWQYTLNKELENGNHTVYTATVNNTGNIIAKSSPYNFIKTAEAITLQDISPIVGIDTPTTSATTSTTTVERPGFLQTKNVIMLGIAFFMILGITFIFIGLLSKKKSGDLA